MRKLMLPIILGLSLFAAPAVASEFCNGYKEGYKSGYMDAKNTGIPPIPPLCPLKPIKNFGDPDSDFRFGYQEGVKDGYMKGISEGGTG